MSRQTKHSELPFWVEGSLKWLRARPHWLADHLLWIIFIFILTSPFIAQIVSSGLEHLFFPELYRAKTSILDRKQFGSPQACDVIGASGTWLSLQCAGKMTIAPLAGVQLPVNHQEAEYVITTLDQIWKLTTAKPSQSGLRCEVQQFGPNDLSQRGAPPNSLLSFAVCTLDGRSIPDILFSVGMPLASADSSQLRLTNSSSQPLPGYFAKPEADISTYVNQEARRTTLLTIEGWTATILGFAFASFSIFYTRHERSSKGKQYHREADDAFYEFKRLLRQSGGSSGALLEAIYAAAAQSVGALRAAIQKYADHKNQDLTKEDRLNFEYVHRHLSNKQTPDPDTLAALLKRVEDLL